MNKTVLVTGAPGWLGTRLVEILREKKRKVRCLVLEESDTSCLKNLDAEIFQGDLTDIKTLKDLTKNMSTVFHCAGIIHPKKISDFYRINLNGTKNILQQSVADNVDKFIHISSNSAQGRNIKRNILMNEDQKEKPEKNYGKSKYRAEQVVKEFQNANKIQTVILRPCWFYGIRQPERVTRLFNMIRKGRPLIFGDGKNLRSMTYIDNLTDAMLLAESKSIANGKTYWIADERPYQTIEIYQEIAHQLNIDLKPRFVPKLASRICEGVDDTLQFFGLYSTDFHVAGEMVKNIACNIDKAKKELGFKPKVDLKEGLRRSVEWCRQNNLLD